MNYIGSQRDKIAVETRPHVQCGAISEGGKNMLWMRTIINISIKNRAFSIKNRAIQHL